MSRAAPDARVSRAKLKADDIPMFRSYRPGDPAPRGYLNWHDWARVQMDGGLKQTRCPHGRWLFPQEIDDCLVKMGRLL